MSSKTTTEKIIAKYGLEKPKFAFCLGGTRRLSVDPDDPRARKMLLEKGVKYLSNNQALIFKLLKTFPVDLYMDIGVNYGECLVSVPFHYEGRIVGYEANSSLFPYIEKTILYNDDIESLQVKNLAVSDDDQGFIDFYIDKKWSGKSSAINLQSHANMEKVAVPTTTIDKEVGDAKNLDFFLIKLDVEGYEPSVLKGAKNSFKSITNVIVLMEFDSKFIEIGGEKSQNFLESILSQFHTYILLRNELSKVHSFSDLDQYQDSDGRVHVDLVMTKLTGDHLARFKDEIVPSSIRYVRKEYFAG